MNNVEPRRSLQPVRPGRRLPAVGVGRRVLQPRRPLAVREHPDAGDHVCDHRAVGERVRCKYLGGLVAIREPRPAASG